MNTQASGIHVGISRRPPQRHLVWVEFVWQGAAPQLRVSVGAFAFGVGGRRRSLPRGEPWQDTRMRVRWKRWNDLGHGAVKSRLELWQ